MATKAGAGQVVGGGDAKGVGRVTDTKTPGAVWERVAPRTRGPVDTHMGEGAADVVILLGEGARGRGEGSASGRRSISRSEVRGLQMPGRGR